MQLPTTLEQLIHRNSETDFFLNIYDRAPHVLGDRGNKTPISHVEQLLAYGACLDLSYGDGFFFTRNGHGLPGPFRNGFSDTSSIFSTLLKKGWTYGVNELVKKNLYLRAFMKELQAPLSSATGLNAYCTPPGSQGFKLHSDGHDVIIWQQCGSKAWKVFDRSDPLGERKALIDTELAAGEILYIPQGFPHAGQSCGDDCSVHLTVSFISETNQIKRRLSKEIDAIELSYLRSRIANSADGRPAARLDRSMILAASDVLNTHLKSAFEPKEKSFTIRSGERIPLTQELINAQSTQYDDTTVLELNSQAVINTQSGPGIKIANSGIEIGFRKRFAPCLEEIIEKKVFRPVELEIDQTDRHYLMRVLSGAGIITLAS